MNRAILLLTLLSLAAAAWADGITQVVTYRSPVDNSDQQYGVYVPDGGSPAGGYPVVLHAHGYGWWVGTGFSKWQQDWADAHRWILVQLNARGPNFYWGIGDIATQEVIADLDKRFGIDRKRVYITGGSMGGTGAYRQGVAHPETFAAAVGVDGWTDFREWHWHWYARKDQRDDIEEFRRPLLEAASPLYQAERSRWGDVFVVADGRDDVVYPTQGLDLAARLQDLKLVEPGAYDPGFTLTPDRGHCGSYDLGWIYNYFLGKSARPERASFRIATTVLEHGEMYWGRMERLHYQGEKAILDCSCDQAPASGGTGGPPVRDPRLLTVDAITTNLDGFTLFLERGPAAGAQAVRIYVDGIEAYDGPPQTLSFEALRDGEDNVVGWVEERTTKPGLHKSREIGGPLGHAFSHPFLVCYGTDGPEANWTRNRDEAAAFCRGWNDFVVHARTLQPVPEDQVAEGDLQRKNLVVYGNLETSRLLRRAQGQSPLPVEVHADRIVVRDPLTGDREYRGRKFGVFSAYPNPLTAGRTYLVVCQGRFATTADGGSRQGLEFDLEKLSWGYSDYVIFNTDTADLPHVMNVNNKPPVTCYEAGYFVEAGYFDADWRPDRFATLDRVRRTRPKGVRLIHVAEAQVGLCDSLPVFDQVDGDPPDPPRRPLARPVMVAMVKVVDADGNPVRQARVTGRWAGVEADAFSRPTLSNGIAYLPFPGGASAQPPRFVVLNVMATGAEYDFEADTLQGSAWLSADGALGLKPASWRLRVDPDFVLPVSARVANLSDSATDITAAFVPPNGEITQAPGALRLGPGESRTVSFRWRPDPACPAGDYTGTVQAVGGGSSVQWPLRLTFPARRAAPIRIATVAGKDVGGGEAYELKAKVRNEDPAREATVALGCTILEACRHLPAQEVRLPAGATAELVWRPTAGERPLPMGEYQARVTLLGAVGISAAATFTVRPG